MSGIRQSNEQSSITTNHKVFLNDESRQAVYRKNPAKWQDTDLNNDLPLQLVWRRHLIGVGSGQGIGQQSISKYVLESTRHVPLLQNGAMVFNRQNQRKSGREEHSEHSIQWSQEKKW